MVALFLAETNETEFSAISALDAQMHQYKWNESSWNLARKNNRNLLFCHKENEVLVGFILVELNPWEEMCHLHKIVVDEKWRKRGIAKNLFGSLESYLKTASLFKIYLEVAEQNEAAIKLYQSLNFKQINHVKAFYSNGSDALIMLKEIF